MGPDVVSDSMQRVSPSGYYGRRMLEYQTSSFQLTESIYDRLAVLPLHSHANAHFCLVLSGSYTERLGELQVQRLPGDLIFYAAGVGHAEQHHASGRHFMIEIGPELAGSGVPPRGAPAWSSSRGSTRTLATRIFAEFRGDRRVPAARMTSLIERLVDAAHRRVEPRQPWLLEVECELREIVEGSADLDRLAREAGVHPVHLGRAFRRAYGCTPGEFLRRLRVERAQRALAAAENGLADVAYAAGFCDQSHLNRVFKSQTGMTPGRYRRLAAPPE